MSALSNIPPQAVLPLGAYDRHSLEQAAVRADQRTLAVELSGAADRESVMTRIGRDFGLPAHYGRNLDALYDCLVELEPVKGAEQPGFLVIIENIPECDGFGRSDREALLDVFRDAAGFFYDAGTAFRVFYSVAPVTG